MNSTNLEQLSLLLVEDSPGDVFLVKEVMKQEGIECRVAVVDDGESAIKMLDRVDAGSEIAPSLLLLDLNIPRQSGTEVLQRTRLSPLCRKTPVVIMSTSDMPEERQRALELGATEYFRKPSSLAEFMELGKLVRRLLESAA